MENPSTGCILGAYKVIVWVYYRVRRYERAAIEGADLSISPFFLLRAGASFFRFQVSRQGTEHSNGLLVSGTFR